MSTDPKQSEEFYQRVVGVSVTPLDTETDWKEGSPIVHRGEYQGRPYEDRGEILEIDPPRLLRMFRNSCRSAPSAEPDS
jgi:hypothetical protein